MHSFRKPVFFVRIEVISKSHIRLPQTAGV